MYRQYIFRMMILTGLLMLLSIGSFAYDSNSSDQFSSPNPLLGVQAVAVTVDEVRQEYGRYGLTTDGLKADLEQQLQTAGLQIIDASALSDTQNSALLKLRLRINENGYYYSYGMNLSLWRKLALENNAFTTIKMWSDSQVGAIQTGEFRRLDGVLDKLAESFIQTHRQQNAG